MHALTLDQLLVMAPERVQLGNNLATLLLEKAKKPHSYARQTVWAQIEKGFENGCADAYDVLLASGEDTSMRLGMESLALREHMAVLQDPNGGGGKNMPQCLKDLQRRMQGDLQHARDLAQRELPGQSVLSRVIDQQVSLQSARITHAFKRLQAKYSPARGPGSPVNITEEQGRRVKAKWGIDADQSHAWARN